MPLAASAFLLGSSLGQFLAAADLPGCPIAVAGRVYRMVPVGRFGLSVWSEDLA